MKWKETSWQEGDKREKVEVSRRGEKDGVKKKERKLISEVREVKEVRNKYTTSEHEEAFGVDGRCIHRPSTAA